MQSEKELMAELNDLNIAQRLFDKGMVGITNIQRNKIVRKIEFLEEVLK